jgi:hypothetical protein
MKRVVLCAAIVFACAMAVAQNPEQPNPAQSSLTVKLGGKSIVVNCHEPGAAYSVDGESLTVGWGAKSVALSAVGDSIAVQGGEFEYSADEISVSKGGRVVLTARVDGAEPAAAAVEPAVQIQPLVQPESAKPVEAPKIKLRQ